MYDLPEGDTPVRKPAPPTEYPTPRVLKFSLKGPTLTDLRKDKPMVLAMVVAGREACGEAAEGLESTVCQEGGVGLEINLTSRPTDKLRTNGKALRLSSMCLPGVRRAAKLRVPFPQEDSLLPVFADRRDSRG